MDPVLAPAEKDWREVGGRFRWSGAANLLSDSSAESTVEHLHRWPGTEQISERLAQRRSGDLCMYVRQHSTENTKLLCDTVYSAESIHALPASASL